MQHFLGVAFLGLGLQMPSQVKLVCLRMGKAIIPLISSGRPKASGAD